MATTSDRPAESVAVGEEARGHLHLTPEGRILRQEGMKRPAPPSAAVKLTPQLPEARSKGRKSGGEPRVHRACPAIRITKSVGHIDSPKAMIRLRLQ
jgi:hypothetical protein